MLDWAKKLFSSSPPRDALGQRGENVAAKYLRDQGFKIINRNYRCDVGEVDIIARDGPTLVFVEVKTRSYDDPITRANRSTPVLRHQITKAARFYLSRWRNAAAAGQV